MKEIRLTKPRAKTEIIFKPDKDDDWFIWIISLEKKSGNKTQKMIVQKDMQVFLDDYLEKGWVITNGEVEVETKAVKNPPKKKPVKPK